MTGQPNPKEDEGAQVTAVVNEILGKTLNELSSSLSSYMMMEVPTAIASRFYSAIDYENNIGLHVGSHVRKIMNRIQPMILATTVPGAMSDVLPMYVLEKLRSTLTNTLTRSLVHSLTATLSHTLGRKPDAGHCHRCSSTKNDPSCRVCYQSMAADRVKLAASNYYESYYSDYYADYYTRLNGYMPHARVKPDKPK